MRFQNTGNAPAQNIRLEDQLSSMLNWNAMQPLASSHPMTTMIDETGKAIFTFENIMLPDSTSDEPGSHGYVLFEIEMNADVPHLTTIENMVNIYFDFNFQH